MTTISERDEEMLILLAIGLSVKTVCGMYGISKMRVSHIKKKHTALFDRLMEIRSESLLELTKMYKNKL